MKLNELQTELKKIIYGFSMSQCVYAAAALGIADCLKDSPMTCAELASITSSHPDTLRRLLRALADIGILREDERGRFSLTQLGGLLRADAEGSMKAEILHMLHPSLWGSWGQLLQSVKSGKAAFPEIFGKDAWKYRSENPEAGSAFEKMAAEKSKLEVDIILQHLDLSNVGKVIDVGGGNGALIANILSNNKDLHGVLFDQPEVLAGADDLLEAAGAADRCRVIGGDFLNEIPKGGDLYLLKSVIHNWDDENALAILRNCRKAISSNARIVLLEYVLDSKSPSDIIIMDLHMLVLHGGKERTSSEFGSLLDASGFRLKNILTTSCGISLIEGIPV